MILNERKIKILQAIINDYIETAEPVGSRTIAKKYNLGISSATIRNEMADLEEMGYIIQPHLSAGRIPSDKGYRLYVDELMTYKQLDDSKIKVLEEVIENSINKIDYLMEQTAKALAELTNYTAISSKPKTNKTKIKRIQLMPLDSNSIILVCVTDTNVIKNHIINVTKTLEQEDLIKISNLLNENLYGLTIEEITSPLIEKIEEQMGNHSQILNPILDGVTDAIQRAEETEINLSGAKNILEYPEFNDISKAKVLFQMLEEKNILDSIINSRSIDKIEITIGDENDITEIKECSIVKTTYTISNKQIGTIGILGPKRMDYSEVVSMLAYISKNIDDVLRKISGG